MEKLPELGLVKSIGVSNFNSKQLERLMANCRIKPVTNQVNLAKFSFKMIIKITWHISQICNLIQVEASPQFNQKTLIKFCKEHDIIVTAYSPLGRPVPAEKKPDFLYDPRLAAIAKKYNKTPVQVVFRYLVSGSF